MEKISVLIVEDQLLIAQNLKAILTDHDFDVLETVVSGEDAIDLVNKTLPDLILMDIHLAGELDGIATAEKIRQKHDIPIIYLSDHTDSETVDRAKKTFPANYLSKPFRTGDLLRALEIAFVNAAKPAKTTSTSKLKDRIFIRIDNQKSKMISYEDIIYLEADRAYSSVMTDEKEYKLSNNMRIISDQINSSDFIKVSRKHIININRVTGIDGNMIKLGDKHEVQMSKSYRDDVMSCFNLIK
ncbi:response regulator [Fulvivirga ulvae]|uniref:response regulator n=1 Tax=Fulvivirga ulvae TaxID=2904245 RepID=UPI001F41B840|nr:response regulator [Fulvivirga ulvae]UII33914.1 response regulator [Fulvivirga ulvae]